MSELDLPLFPLSTVLYPGGRLDLRIFERRYIDMVRDCTRANTGFGVCLIVRGREAGEPAVPAAYGTLARIVDFSVGADGLLGITARGEARFHVEHTRVRDSGLVIGRVRLLEIDPVLPVPPEHGLLATILERVAEKFDAELSRAPRARLDDAAWVAFRLAEILPLDNEERQQLLQLQDPIERLARLSHWLPRFQRH